MARSSPGGDRIADMSQERWGQAKKLTLAQVLTKNLQAKTWADCYGTERPILHEGPALLTYRALFRDA